MGTQDQMQAGGGAGVGVSETKADAHIGEVEIEAILDKAPLFLRYEVLRKQRRRMRPGQSGTAKAQGCSGRHLALMACWALC